MKAEFDHRIATGASALAGLVMGWFACGMAMRSPPNPPDSTYQKIPASPPALRGAMSSDVARSIHDVHAAGPPAAQMLAALELALRISPEDFARYLANERFLPDHQAKGVFVRAILRRWIESDPHAALAWCLANNRELVREAMKEWARRDMPSAEEFASRFSGTDQTEFRGAIFSLMAARDPDTAYKWLAQFGSSEPHWRPGDGLNELAKADPARLLEAAESFSTDLRHRARQAAIFEWARRDFDAALEWTLEQPDRRGLLERVINAGGPSRAFSVLSGLPESEQNQIVNAFGYDWRRHDPVQLLAALKSATGLSKRASETFLRNVVGQIAHQNPPGAIDQLMSAFPDQISIWAPSVASTMANRDPEAARRFAESLEDEKLRERTLESIRRYEPMPAGTPFERMSASLQTNRYLESHQLLALSAAERLALWEQAHTQSDGQRSFAGSNLDGVMYGSYPADLAAGLAARPPDDPTTVELASQLASRWVNEEPDAASQWVMTMPAGKARSSAVENLVRQWFRDDPGAADTWVKTLPADFERDAVSKATADPSGGR